MIMGTSKYLIVIEIQSQHFVLLPQTPDI